MAKINIPEPEEVTLNLIPIMNLFTALIPFLLLSAAFVHLSVIKISVPVAAEGGEETDIAKEEDKITLNLNISKTAFEMSGSSDTLAPKLLKGLVRSVPRPRGADLDARKAAFARVSEYAYEIKGKYAASDTVIIVADEDIQYEEVVGAMDAVRDIIRERDGNKNRLALFPRVVLSSIVK